MSFFVTSVVTPPAHLPIKALAAIHASQRQIARTLGVSRKTVGRDLGGPFVPPPDSELTTVESTRSDDPMSGGATEDRANTEQTVDTGGPNGPTLLDHRD